MLSFASLPLYFWADAIAAACFTQNRSYLNKRFSLTPYEIINNRKPNVKFSMYSAHDASSSTLKNIVTSSTLKLMKGFF